MSKRFFDYDDGDFGMTISDNMAMDSDGNLMIRMSDNMAMDMDSGEEQKAKNSLPRQRVFCQENII